MDQQHQQQENEILKKEVAALRAIIARAKDATPVERPSFKRVLAIAYQACMNVKRIAGGYLLFMGNLQRRFKRLTEIWELLTQEEWLLSDIFPQMNDAPLPKPRLRKKNPSIASYPDNQTIPFAGKQYYETS